MTSIPKITALLFTLLAAFGVAQDSEDLLHYSVQSGNPSQAPAETIVTGTPLDPARMRERLGQLPDLPQKDRAPAITTGRPIAAPPQKGNTQPLDFAPRDLVDTPPDTSQDSRPLQVIRMAPQGNVQIVSEVQITFNQPVIPLASHKTLDAAIPAITIEPPPPQGAWRWVSPQSLLFQTKGPFPLATNYTVNIPAGITTQDGKALLGNTRFSFSTPPLEIHEVHAQGNNIQPIIAVLFNQDVDLQRVTSFLQLYNTQGDIPFDVLPHEEALEKIPMVRNQYLPLLFLRPQVPVAGSNPQIRLRAGAPSLEGPRTSVEGKPYPVRTPQAFRLQHQPSSFNLEDGIQIRFNNPLKRPIPSGQVAISPQVPNLDIGGHYSTIQISGDFQPHTTYTLTIDGQLQDQYTQKLGQGLSFQVKSLGHRPALYFNQGKTVLDPDQKPRVPVDSINLDAFQLQIRRVKPSDFPKFTNHGEEAPGELVFDDTVSIEGARSDQKTRTWIDLRPYLKAGHQYWLSLKVPFEVLNPDENRRLQPAQPPLDFRQWVQVTQMAVDTFHNTREAFAFVTNLKDGKPIADAEVKLFDGKGKVLQSGKSDASGYVSFPLNKDTNYYVTAQTTDDFCHSQEFGHFYNDHTNSWRVFSTSDRKLYRPGETVSFKGWVRYMDAHQASLAKVKVGSTIDITFQDRNGQTLTTLQSEITDFGGFDAQFKLPDDIPLGHVSINMVHQDFNAYNSIQVEEFRTPEFEVNIQADKTHYQIGDSGTFTTKARYYAGGGLKQAPVNINTRTEYAHFQPPGFSQFHFGYFRGWRGWGRPGGGQTKNHTGFTDHNGDFPLEIQFHESPQAFPVQLQINTQVQDLNNQTWSAQSQTLVHPAQFTVGLKMATYFSAKDQKTSFKMVVSDLDGTIQPGIPVTLKVQKSRWDQTKKETVYETESDFQFTSAAEPSQHQVTFKDNASYRILASVRDGAGRESRTLLNHWCFGKNNSWYPKTKDAIALKLDKEIYQIGDTAKLLVTSPIAGQGSLLIHRGTLAYKTNFESDGVALLELPIEEEMLGGASITVILSGEDEAGLPVQFEGSQSLPVSRETVQLQIHLDAPEYAAPQAEITVSGQVSQAGGELLLFAVDEAILHKANYQLANPHDTFIPTNEGSLAQFQSFRSKIRRQLNRVAARGHFNDRMPHATEMMAARPRSKSAGPGQQPVAIRKDFTPLAFWFAAVQPDGQGRFSQSLTLPDNLTRYRIMAIAASGDRHFGTAERLLTARLPLSVRPSAPRFLNIEDRFQMPVIVQNQTDAPLDVELVARGENIEIHGAIALTIPANDRISVHLNGQAGLPGLAFVQVAVFNDDSHDAAQVVIPIQRPASAEAFAMSGSLEDGSIALGVEPPEDVFSEYGALQIGLSGSMLADLDGASDYLQGYRFDCTEQIASRILGALAMSGMQELYTDFDEEKTRGIVSSEIAKLESRQNGDGGFSFWKRGQTSLPYLSTYIGYALAKAQASNHTVPRHMLQRNTRYLQRIENVLPQNYGQEMAQTIYAFAYHTLSISGAQTGNLRQQAIGDGIETMPLEALGHLISDFNLQEWKSAFQHLSNRVTETSDSAHFVTRYSRDQYALLLQSNRRTDAIILQHLARADVAPELTQKLVKGLFAGRRKGYWGNTQENAFALLACEAYFRAREETPPNFNALAWYGQTGIIDGAVTDYDQNPQLTVPMAFLQEQGPAQLTFQRIGQGRMYYHARLNYLPRNLQQDPLERGFYVSRTYEAVNDPEDVVRNEAGWLIRAGAEIRVTVTVTNKAVRDHVALVDPLPAGFESIQVQGNRRFRGIWHYPSTWNHYNLRSVQSEAFATRLRAGTHSFTYTARATTPGEFIAPPPRAEEMYSPDTFGHGASEVVVIR